MQKVCKKCNGTGKVLEHITYGGGTYGNKGYCYNVYMEDKCDNCKGKGKVFDLFITIKNFFNKGDNSVTA